MEYKVGDIVEAEVANIENYGIFLQLKSGYSGLLHISEISDGYVSNIRNIAFPGEKIYVKIMEIDKKTKHVKLSAKNIKYRKLDINSNIPRESPHGFEYLKKNLPIMISKKIHKIEQNTEKIS